MRFLGLAHLKGLVGLLQITASGKSPNRAKKVVISEANNSKTATSNAIECILSATDSYIENLSIQGTGLQPVPLELVVTIQLLSAKSPAEKRVQSRKRIDRSRLIGLQ